MKIPLLLALVALTVGAASAADSAVDAGLAAITQLGAINGQALACKEQDVAARAKQLMLIHAPRTSQYGTAFEQATQQGFLNQVHGATGCPAASELAGRIDAVAADLNAKLPVAQ